MRNVTFKSLLIATSLTLTGHTLSAALSISETTFAEAFYTNQMSIGEKRMVSAALEKVPAHEHELFTRVFSPPIKTLSSSFYVDSVISAAAALLPSDWEAFSTFIESLFFSVQNQISSPLEHTERYREFWGAPFSRVVTNVAHYVPVSHRKAFLNFIKTQIHSPMNAADMSWLIAALSKIPMDKYEYVKKHSSRFIPKDAKHYDRALMMEGLGRVQIGDDSALDYAHAHITPSLSYEHRSNILTTFAKTPKNMRSKLSSLANKLSKERTFNSEHDRENYLAWIIRALGHATTLEELNQLYLVLESKAKELKFYHDLEQLAIRWKVNQSTL